MGLLDEFDYEAHAEAAEKEDSEEEAAPGAVQFLPIAPDEVEAQDQVRTGLVELGGMLGFGLAVPFENHSPGQGCDIAVNLGIEEIAQADEASGEGHRYAEMVHDPEEVETVPLPVMS